MELNIVFHNVGHGQAVHVFTPSGQTIVIDLGSSADFSPLRWLRDKTGTIDSLVITHPHGDHIAEILELERLGFSVRQIWRPKWISQASVRGANQSSYSSQVDRYLTMNSTYTAPILPFELVGNPLVSGGVTIQTFAATDCSESNINNHSGVVVIEYLGVKHVIPGDNEAPSWRSLLLQPSFRSAIASTNVFMPSHHGRESGYCGEIFEVFKPSLCVISDHEACDTDASAKYRDQTTGWTFHSRSGIESTTRYVTTTRCDGMVWSTVGRDADGSRFLQVTGD
jgi:beta-lactamase superfamily II metal-dependent hydrolase